MQMEKTDNGFKLELEIGDDQIVLESVQGRGIFINLNGEEVPYKFSDPQVAELHRFFTGALLNVLLKNWRY